MKSLLHISLVLTLILGLSSCGSDDNPGLALNFKLQYDNEPLVMFQDVTYPSGEIMQVKRVSFFVSNITVQNAEGIASQVSEVEYIDLTDSHIDITSAEQGLTMDLGSTDLLSYDEVTFNIGLNPQQNSTVPEDYRSSSPLSRSAEYWRSWESFIFIKLEGSIDYNQNGVTESTESFTLHMGSDAVMRDIAIDVANSESPVEINIDVKDIFENNNVIYDIEGGARLHTLDAPTLERMDFLADGLAAAITQ